MARNSSNSASGQVSRSAPSSGRCSSPTRWWRATRGSSTERIPKLSGPVERSSVPTRPRSRTTIPPPPAGVSMFWKASSTGQRRSGRARARPGWTRGLGWVPASRWPVAKTAARPAPLTAEASPGKARLGVRGHSAHRRVTPGRGARRKYRRSRDPDRRSVRPEPASSSVSQTFVCDTCCRLRPCLVQEGETAGGDPRRSADLRRVRPLATWPRLSPPPMHRGSRMVSTEVLC